MEDKSRKGTLNSDKSEQNSSNFVQNVTNFVDRHLYYIRFTSYGVAAVGVILIGRSIHISRKFFTVKDIPSKYIQEHLKLQARVKSVNNEGVLEVDHIPIIQSRFSRHKRKDDDKLQVSLGGVELLPESVPWLQDRLTAEVVWFRMLTLTDEATLQSIVTTKKGIFRNECINETIIKEGLATVTHIEGMTNDATYNRLCEKLLKAQVYAEKKGKGIWTRPSLKERIKSAPRTAASSISTYFKDWFTYLFRRSKND